jgi:hypothetical protein
VRNAYRKPKGKRPIGRSGHRLKDNAYVFIYGLLKDDVSNSDHIASNEMIN